MVKVSSKILANPNSIKGSNSPIKREFIDWIFKNIVISCWQARGIIK